MGKTGRMAVAAGLGLASAGLLVIGVLARKRIGNSCSAGDGCSVPKPRTQNPVVACSQCAPASATYQNGSSSGDAAAMDGGATAGPCATIETDYAVDADVYTDANEDTDTDKDAGTVIAAIDGCVGIIGCDAGDAFAARVIGPDAASNTGEDDAGEAVDAESNGDACDAEDAGDANAEGIDRAVDEDDAVYVPVGGDNAHGDAEADDGRGTADDTDACDDGADSVDGQPGTVPEHGAMQVGNSDADPDDAADGGATSDGDDNDDGDGDNDTDATVDGTDDDGIADADDDDADNIDSDGSDSRDSSLTDDDDAEQDEPVRFSSLLGKSGSSMMRSFIEAGWQYDKEKYAWYSPSEDYIFQAYDGNGAMSSGKIAYIQPCGGTPFYASMLCYSDLYRDLAEAVDDLVDIGVDADIWSSGDAAFLLADDGRKSYIMECVEDEDSDYWIIAFDDLAVASGLMASVIGSDVEAGSARAAFEELSSLKEGEDQR